MRKITPLFLVVTLSACATVNQQEVPGNTYLPVVGAWIGLKEKNHCMEIYIYRDDGTLTVLSGNRRFEDRFSVSQEPNEQGLYKLDGVTRFNTQGVDCTGGSENYVGKPYTFYLKFDASFREMWVYYDLDGGSGFGPLFRFPISYNRLTKALRCESASKAVHHGARRSDSGSPGSSIHGRHRRSRF